MHHLDSLENLKEEVSRNVWRERATGECNPIKEITTIQWLHCKECNRLLCNRLLLIVLVYKQSIIIEVCVPNNVIVLIELLDDFVLISSKLL